MLEDCASLWTSVSNLVRAAEETWRDTRISMRWCEMRFGAQSTLEIMRQATLTSQPEQALG